MNHYFFISKEMRTSFNEWHQCFKYPEFEISENYPYPVRNRATIMKCHEFPDDEGYTCVSLGFECIRKDKLVAQQFIENDDPYKKQWVAHLNGNRDDIRIKNLEWVCREDIYKTANKVFEKNISEENGTWILSFSNSDYEINFTIKEKGYDERKRVNDELFKQKCRELNDKHNPMLDAFNRFFISNGLKITQQEPTEQKPNEN